MLIDSALVHKGQGDWTPPVTPALWGRLQGEQHCKEQWDGDYKPPQTGYGQPQQCQDTNQSSFQAPPAQPAQEQKEKHWYDLDDKQKKELEVLSGFLLLVGILNSEIGWWRYTCGGCIARWRFCCL